MDRDQQIFSLGVNCGEELAYERMRGLQYGDIESHINTLDWNAKKMFEMYDKIKAAFPEVFDKTLNV